MDFQTIIQQCPSDQTGETLRFLAEYYSSTDRSVMKERMCVLQINVWEKISEFKRESIFNQHEELKSIYMRENSNFFFPNLIHYYIESNLIGNKSFLKLLIILLSQLSTRRVLKPILEYYGFSTRLKMSKIDSKILYFLKYPVDDFTGEMKTRADLEEETETLYSKVKQICWHNGMGELGLMSGRILFNSRERVEIFFEKISPLIRKKIIESCFMIEYIDDEHYQKELFIDSLIPTSLDICVFEVLPKKFEKHSRKIHHRVSFLSLHDYLSHHFELLQVEVFGHLHSNFQDAISRFEAGSARMMTKLFSISVVNVKRTSVSSEIPTDVRIELGVDLAGLLPNVKSEWDQLRPGDIVFACCDFFRGFEIFEIVDAQNNIVRPGSAAVGDKRVFRVQMDPYQYYSDVKEGIDYSSFNSVLRLGASESNFKKSLDAIVYSMSAPSLPEWFQDLFVGYGRSAEGLTLVASSPGCGQIETIANEISAAQSGRTLIVAKSNETLNTVLAAIENAGYPGHALLKYGGSQEEVYSRTGRINHMLELRQNLLLQVKGLAISIGIDPSLADDYSYNCDSANQFFLNRIEPIWKSKSEVFPFQKFCDKYALDSSFSSISNLFTLLAKCAPYEILRTVRDRSDYLFHCQAEVVAMTSTGCALAAKEIRKTAPFSNIFVFEASQMMDVETFICIGPKCEKLVLLGDEQMLGPVVTTNVPDQTLFSRLIQLGIQPERTQLNRTKEYSAAVLNLFAWRYDVAENLDYSDLPSGEVQFVNVPDYLGSGELEPSPHQFQNLGEAEYIVGLYMYLQLTKMGDSIAILTPYNAQKNLIMDVLRAKCPMFPTPIVSTIDQFQGQVADTVLISLVRTTAPGQVKDIRRLTVALSRGRHNLFIFGRYALFKTIPGEVGQAFEYMAEGKGVTLTIGDPRISISGVDHMWKHLQVVMENEISKSNSI